MAGVAFALLASAGFAVFQIINRRALGAVDVYRGTAALLGVGAALLLLIAAATGGLAAVGEAPVSSLAYFGLAGFVHFFCGWTFLGWSQVRLGAARTGVLLGTLPLFGAGLAALVLDEPLTLPIGLGLVLVVAGVGIVLSARGSGGGLEPGRLRWGAAAGFAAALCWSASPVLIRFGLRGLPSPLTGAALGMAASAVVYGLAVLATARRARRSHVTPRTRYLLVAAGAAVSLSIWMQWTAFDLAPIAVALAVLQLTPILVVALAVTVGGDVLRGDERLRVWTGAIVTVSGSLVVVAFG